MKLFEHRGAYDPNNPVLIFERKSDNNGTTLIKGVIKVEDSVLNIGDPISSIYIGTIGSKSLPYKVWEVIAIEERNTPTGHYIIDVTNSGFTAKVVPASDEVFII